MEILRCTQCKGDLDLSDDGLIGRCKFCGAVYHFKQTKSEKIVSLLNQANVSRLKGDYDSAILAYQIVLKEDETDADAYWGVVLSTFGIDYVEEKSGELVPTCRRTIKHSIFDDIFYKNAVRFADEEQAKYFEAQAKKIDLLQQNIKQKINLESDFDVFICFKSSNDDGTPTKDRVIARKIYDQLQKNQINTFFSEVTLKDRLGQDFEPIIYKALYSCKYFILVVTDPDFLQTPWVRNEWTRFRDRASEEGLEDRTITVFENLKQNDLPPIFRKQGIDIQKYPAGGFEIEICDALKLKLDNVVPQSTSAISKEQISELVEQKLQGTRETYRERLDRATGYFDIGEKQKAIEILEQTIDMYPRKYQGWWIMTKFLTDNFGIDPQSVHGTELEQKIKYNFENAKMFATLKQQDNIKKQSASFFAKLENFEKVDQICDSYQQDLEMMYQLQAAGQEINHKNAKQQKNIKQTIDINNKKILQLKRKLSNKNYYIKNLPKQKNFVTKMLRFMAVVIFMTAIIGTTIKLIVDAQTNPNVLGLDAIEGGILLILGFVPYFVGYKYEQKRRIKKMQNVIDQDEQLLISLQQQNKELESQLEQSTGQKNVDAFQQQKIQSSLDFSQNRLQQLAQLDYLKQYMLKKNQEQSNNIDNQIFNLDKYKCELEQESNQLEESNIKKIDLQISKTPKYYNEKFEKQQQKSEIYFRENQKYLDILDGEISKTENLLNLEKYKKENGILKKVLNQTQNDNQNLDKKTENDNNLIEQKTSFDDKNDVSKNG